MKGDRVRFDGREVGWGNLVEVWVGVGGACLSGAVRGFSGHG